MENPRNPTPLNLADLTVTTFDTTSAFYQPLLPTTDPTAETRCFYCPINYTYDGACI